MKKIRSLVVTTLFLLVVFNEVISLGDEYPPPNPKLDEEERVLINSGIPSTSTCL